MRVKGPYLFIWGALTCLGITGPAFGFTPIRANSGGPAYTDSLGQAWGADQGTLGIDTYATSNAIGGTIDSKVYQTERHGLSFQYKYTVPNGVYTVNLKFAEIWWTQPNQRVFNVAINNATVLSNFDIVAQAGPFAAIDKSFTVSVTGGQITIQFTSVVDHAKVSAVEIFQASTATRVNAGGAAYTDPTGQAWSAGACSGTSAFSVTSAITATTAPVLYQSECFGKSFQYQFPVANGTYTVNLKFAELWWTQANQRVFNVTLNGKAVLANFDIFAQAKGKNIAVDRSFTVPVTDGQITIQFSASVDNAKVNAIEILGGTVNTGTPLSITTNALPGGTVGTAYSQPLAAAGGTAPYTWSLASGLLPPGLSLAPSTGLISGTPTTSTGSPFSVTVQVADAAQAKVTKSLSVAIASAPTTTTRVNVGGSAYTDPAGQVWSAGPCSGTSTFSVTNSISNSTTPVLYQSECYGSSFQYQFPVANGTYTVNLKFAELWWTQANQRVFNVVINGGTVLSNFDIFAQAGGTNIAVDRSFTVPVIDGQITIQFTASIDNAKVSAIEIVGGTVNTGTPLSITTNALPGGTVGTAYSQALAATGGKAPYTWSVASGSLPPGLSLAPTGTISGTPTTSTGSPFGISAKVTDATAATATQVYSLIINAAPVPPAQTVSEEFVCGNPCPFPSWINVRAAYGARGDGITDDTAAIQAALNDAGTAGHGSVVYLAAGTYKITRNLYWAYKAGVSLVGHDPADTTIVWAGPAAGTVACEVPSTASCPNGGGNQRCTATSMLWMNGVSGAKVARITWNGNGSAGIGVYHNWDRLQGNADNTVTNLHHEDEVFTNLRKGVVSGGAPCGQNDEQLTLMRVKFQNNSVAGYSSESMNALGNVFWDSSFINNAVGVSSTIGESNGTQYAGNFHVYNSFFSGNGTDISANAMNLPTARHNFSQNAGAGGFFKTAASGQPVAIQGNTIVDPSGAAIQITGAGGYVITDNVIRNKAGNTSPAIVYTSDAGHSANLSSMGNTFTVSSPVTVCGATAPGSGGNCGAHWWSLDDQTVASVNVAPPVMPGTLPTSADLKRTVLELGGVCGSSIQSCITYACTNLSGQRPIVHLPVGNYSVGSTITIPANCDVQLVGDGYNTALTWAGGSGPMIRADGPSKATLKDLMMWNGTTAIDLANADQPGSRMYAVGMRIENTEAIVTDNLQNTAVDFINEQGGQPWNTSKPTVAVNGPGAGVGSSYVGFWGHMHGGGQGGSMYSVTNGGQLYAIDAWDEVGYQTTVAASGAANFTGSGIHWPPGPDGAPAGGDWISMSGVNGNIAMLGSRISNSGSYRGIKVNSELSTSNGIFLGNYNDVFNGGTFFNRTAPGSGNFLFQGNTGGDMYGSSNAVEVATPSSASMARTALAGYRNTWPKPLSSNGSGVTDFRVFRVYISGGTMGIHVSR